MSAVESQLKAFSDFIDYINRPVEPTIHHACEDFDGDGALFGFTLRLVFDWSRRYSDVWPDVTITHAYIVTPNTQIETPVPLADLDIDLWESECAGRVDERR